MTNTNLFLCILLLLFIISLSYYGYKNRHTLFNEEYYQNTYSFIPPSSPVITPNYNPFHTYISPQTAASLVNIPPKYKSFASQSWIANAVAQCNSYNTSSTFGAPKMPQDCPDSSFTYIDQPDYKGCIQLQTNSNYCMSDNFGNYRPNMDKLDVSRF